MEMFSPENQEAACEEFIARVTNPSSIKGCRGIKKLEVERFGPTSTYEYPNPSLIALGKFASQPDTEVILPWASRQDPDYKFDPTDDTVPSPIPHQAVAIEYTSYIKNKGSFIRSRMSRPRLSRNDQLLSLDALAVRAWHTEEETISVVLPTFQFGSHELKVLHERLATACQLLPNVAFYTEIAQDRTKLITNESGTHILPKLTSQNRGDRISYNWMG